MSVFDSSPPAFSNQQLVELARQFFDIDGEAAPLVSERDQNTKITARGDGESFVLKIANANEQKGLLELQNAAMVHIALVSEELEVPRVCQSVNNQGIEWTEGADGQLHATRLLTFLSGNLFSNTQKTLPLLRSLGSFVGKLSNALKGFSHPAAHRFDFLWNLDNALAVSGYINDVSDTEDRYVIQSVFDRYQSNVLAQLPKLPMSIIHSDVNDNNVVIDTSDAQRVTGLFDFGDMLYARQINELAITMAYALMDVPDIAQASYAIIESYTAQFSLQSEELHVLFDLIEMRLAMSVCISSNRAKQFPDNEYLLISQQPALKLLRTLTAMNTELKQCIALSAAGFPAVENVDVVIDCLSENREEIGSIFLPDLQCRPRTVVSFSEGAPGSNLVTDPEKYNQWLNQRLREKNADYAIGLYAENRTCYKGDRFVAVGSSKPRSVHLGIDIFIEASTPVHAPLAGIIHSIQYNDFPYDYGGTVILEHDIGGAVFYSLYGHLSKNTVALFKAGDNVERGEVIGYIGEPHENGGWSPHLHFQIMTTMLGLNGNFDGAAEADRMHIWSQICPDPNLIMQFPPEAFSLENDREEALLSRRANLLGPSLSLSYKKKLHIVRGEGAWLFDASGRAYLDCVNNICHVGHCHPHVVDAMEKQARTLNTNTRYLHQTILDYAERLAATFPDPLSVVYFVNSGSEANELALRLARTYTQRRHVISLDWGYHGNTAGLVDISPYKFARKGGDGAGDYTQVAELPDPFRGRIKGYAEDAARGYVQSVEERIANIQKKDGEDPAAFIAESISGCGGQIVFPDNYLKFAFEEVKKAGGVCIADEVQTGFGRVGDAMWAFELQNARPDIVTVGKPIGNGHPLAAVITTKAIADAFNNGMEFFNSFGGNPVSCSVGMAVLDVIEQECLQENARQQFLELNEALLRLKHKYPIIGDVRGKGLFLGIELVRDRATLEPATTEAGQVINHLCENSVLLSTDGPHDNVLKFKPPMVFREHERQLLVEQLDLAFSQLS